jgi:hypothetical protein
MSLFILWVIGFSLGYLLGAIYNLNRKKKLIDKHNKLLYDAYKNLAVVPDCNKNLQRYNKDGKS